MFIFYSIHYPHPGKEELLVQSMHDYGELMQQQPGNLFQAPILLRILKKERLWASPSGNLEKLSKQPCPPCATPGKIAFLLSSNSGEHHDFPYEP